MKIYVMVFLYTFFMWKYFLNPYLILINSLILVPQIIHNIIHPSDAEFDFNYLVMFSSIKYIIFVILRGVPFNLIEIKMYWK